MSPSGTLVPEAQGQGKEVAAQDQEEQKEEEEESLDEQFEEEAPRISDLQRTRIVGQPQYTYGREGMKRYFRLQCQHEMSMLSSCRCQISRPHK